MWQVVAGALASGLMKKMAEASQNQGTSGGGGGSIVSPSSTETKGYSKLPAINTQPNQNGNTDMIACDSNLKSSTDVSEKESDKKGKKSLTETLSNNEDARPILTKIGSFLGDVGNSSQIQGETFSPTPVQNVVVSDERLKDIFGEETPIDCFAKIHSYEFKYTPEAQEIMQGKDHVDDKEHLGVMAQELLINPATSACVIQDDDGFLKVDTAQLTMVNTATIAELSRKVQKLEEILGER